MSNFGEELKRERELRSISLREVAESTKINIRYLEALEKNEFSHLPGGVFNKGFVRAVSQFIGVDEEAMINAYLLEEQSGDNGAGGADSSTMRGEFGDRFTPEPAPDKKPLLVIGVVVTVVVLLALILYWFFFRTAADTESGPQEAGISQTPVAEKIADDPAVVLELPSADEKPAVEAKPPAGVEQPAAKEETADPEPDPGITPQASTRPTAKEQKPIQVLDVLAIELTLIRPATGRLNCDNRQVEILDGLAAGTRFSFRCDRFLIIDASDGGALQYSIAGAAVVPLDGDGVQVQRRRLTPPGGGQP
jgi:cytoskeletal protein RodZ